MTTPSTTSGKHTPDFTPARRADGAREQSVTSARSRTNTRSRARQALPTMPTPSRNDVLVVTWANSSVTEPESVTKTMASGITPSSRDQNEP